MLKSRLCGGTQKQTSESVQLETACEVTEEDQKSFSTRLCELSFEWFF